jgi:hypothetical protein
VHHASVSTRQVRVPAVERLEELVGELNLEGKTTPADEGGEWAGATKKPRVAGLSQCAREDSNLHGP